MSSDDIDECISALAPWDAIWPLDKGFDWPNWKMWVCISEEHLWFLRINSKCYEPNCLPLSTKLHPWLEHDRFLRYGGDLATFLSEDELKECLEKQTKPERRGILGKIDQTIRGHARDKIQRSTKISGDQKEIISEKLAN